MPHFGAVFTPKIAASFGHLSSQSILTSPTTIPSHSTMFSLAPAQPLRIIPPFSAEHVPWDTYGFRLAPHAVASNAETAPNELLSPSLLATDPQLPFSSSPLCPKLHHTPETAPTSLAPPFSFPLSIPSSVLYPHAPSATTDDDSKFMFMPSSSPSILPTDSERPQPATDVQPHEPEPAFAYPDIQLLPRSSPIASESHSAHALLPADDQPETEPTSTSSYTHFPFPSSPSASDLESAHPATNYQPELEPVSLSSVTPAPPSPFLSLAPLTDDVPENSSTPLSSHLLAPSVTVDDPKLMIVPPSSSSISPTECPSSPVQQTTEDHPELEPRWKCPRDLPVSPAEPPKNRVPLPPTSPVLPASSNLPPVTPSPSRVLGDLELKSTSTPASLLDSDAVLLSSPECLPSTSSGLNLLLPAPLKFSPSTPVLPLPLPIDFTILMPPGLLGLSPNVLITPPSPSPLKATRLTMFGPISPPLEVLTDVLFSSHSLPSPPPQRPPGLTLQVSTSPESSPPATSTQPVRHMSIPANSTFTSLHIVPSHSLSLSLPSPSPARVNFTLPSPISAISVSDLVKTLSAQAHKFRSKRKDFASSKSNAAKPCNAFAYWLKLKQYTPRSPSFVFDPGGLVLALDPTHEDVFR
ncbi:hypothetical protein EDB83DRAFT_2534965 [Lactarius deliciosus]|nr:hypothetical protein EDB83DRAFT_2534965 [Lactarius deliciosus]